MICIFFLIRFQKAETEVLIQKNADFRKKLEAAGGELLNKSFQLAKLDLICPLPGYVVNSSTNNCRKKNPLSAKFQLAAFMNVFSLI